MGDSRETRRPGRPRKSIHDISVEPHFGEVASSASPHPPDARADAAPASRDAPLEALSSVWDEPSTAGELTGAPRPDALTYAAWLEAAGRRTTRARRWATVLLVALAAGPWGVIGTIVGSLNLTSLLFDVALAILVAPVVEEISKTAIAQTILEVRPYLFRHPGQLILTGLAGGLAFAATENVMYLRVYIADPPPGLITWRWTVCVALHMTCSAIASLGLVRSWRNGMTHRRRPRIADAVPWLYFAMFVHAVYNAFAIYLDYDGFAF